MTTSSPEVLDFSSSMDTLTEVYQNYIAVSHQLTQLETQYQNIIRTALGENIAPSFFKSEINTGYVVKARSLYGEQSSNIVDKINQLAPSVADMLHIEASVKQDGTYTDVLIQITESKNPDSQNNLQTIRKQKAVLQEECNKQRDAFVEVLSRSADFSLIDSSFHKETLHALVGRFALDISMDIKFKDAYDQPELQDIVKAIEGIRQRIPHIVVQIPDHDSNKASSMNTTWSWKRNDLNQ